MFIQRVIRRRRKHRVEYVLIEGYAVALHGAIRGANASPEAFLEFLESFRPINDTTAKSNLISIKMRVRFSKVSAVSAKSTEYSTDIQPEIQVQHDVDLERAFHYLPERTQRVFRMKLEGARYGEIAESLGVSVGAIKMIVNRGMASSFTCSAYLSWKMRRN